MTNCLGIIETIENNRRTNHKAVVYPMNIIMNEYNESYHLKGNMYRACVQSVLTYGTETWALKAGNLHSLK